MKQHQTLDYVKKGLLMTLFCADENLITNFLLFFGDSDVRIERKESLGNGRYEYLITADTKKEYLERYHRAFLVSVAEITNIPRYNFQIVGIDEC